MSALAQVHVLAVGARTPVGLTAEATAAAVRAGISRHATHPFMVDHRGDPMRCARDARLPVAILGWQRLAALAEGALDEVIDKLDLDTTGVGPVSVSVALPERRPGFEDRDAEQVLAAVTAHVATRSAAGTLRIEKAPRGHAGGLVAIHAAAERIAQGAADLCIVGGADSYFEADTIDWLIEERQLRGDESRNGFIPGEAAGFVVLAGEGARRHLRRSSLGWMRGSGIAHEAKRIKTDDVNSGEGLADAVRGATRALQVPDQAVDAVYCDINGERYRSEEWGFTLLRLPQACRDTSYQSPAESWGDVGAASGPLLCGLALQSWARAYAPGPRALVWAGSEGGLRGAVVLEEPPSRP